MEHDLGPVRSAIAGMAWPGLPAGSGAAMLAVLHQLDQTQWWTPGDLRRQQLRQAGSLLRHAHETVSFYRERLAGAGYCPGMDVTDDWFTSLPRVTRADVHENGDAFFSTRVPQSHMPVMEGQTSGSTGTPIRFLSTEVTRFFWQAFNLRDHLWHRRDIGLKLAGIRPDRGPRSDAGSSSAGWGGVLDELYATGASGVLHSANTIDRQLEWLVEQDPDYLLTLATNLHELAREAHRRGVRFPRLREARTYGDTLRPEARAECVALLGVKVVDMYTCQEAGYLALQCPGHDLYHVQSENVIVEVVGEGGQPCAAGQTGKVVITTLHNFAMPLIRYEIGDYAEAGAPCACGRGLPVIRRILGRERNLAIAPDGRKYYPSFAAEIWSGIAPIRQIQLVQKSRMHIEVRVAMARQLGDEEAGRLTEALRRSLGHPYEFTYVSMDSIPRSPSGKYEDFVAEAGV